MTNKSKLTIQDGQALIAEFYKSGLNLKIFSKQKNITYHVLQYWKDRCKTLNKSKITSTSNFLPINLAQPQPNYKSSFIKIIVNSKIAIEISNEADLLQLKKLLEICILCG